MSMTLKELEALEAHVTEHGRGVPFVLVYDKPTPSLLEQQGIGEESTANQYCEAIRRHLLDREDPEWIDEVTMFRYMGAKRVIA